VRGVGGRLVLSDSYAIVIIYIKATLPNREEVIAALLYKAHLVDFLSANLLLRTDVLTPHGFNICLSNRTLTFS
jgi:hypothetical protein